MAREAGGQRLLVLILFLILCFLRFHPSLQTSILPSRVGNGSFAFHDKATAPFFLSFTFYDQIGRQRVLTFTGYHLLLLLILFLILLLVLLTFSFSPSPSSYPSPYPSFFLSILLLIHPSYPSYPILSYPSLGLLYSLSFSPLLIPPSLHPSIPPSLLSLHPSILYGNGSFAFYESFTAFLYGCNGSFAFYPSILILCFLRILLSYPLLSKIREAEGQRQRQRIFLSSPLLSKIREAGGQRLLCFLILNG